MDAQSPVATLPTANVSNSCPPSRVFTLEGASNFRDLGGYAGQGGRRVKWGRVFRSDHLGLLTDADVQVLLPLGIAKVCDFRGVQERAPRPSRLPAAPVVPLTIEPTVVQAIEDFARLNGGIRAPDAVDLMQQTYRAFVTDNSHRFAELFEHLLQQSDEGSGALVFHCTAGKDRTGFAAALILHALGVPPDVIQQDYLASNAHYKPPALVGSHVPLEVREAVARVQGSYLQAALDAVQRDYGSVDAYLERGLGLNAARKNLLVEIYLEN